MKNVVSLFALCLCCISARADTVLIPTLTYSGSTNYRAFSIASATSAVSRFGSNVVYDYAIRVIPTNSAPTSVFLLPSVYKCTFDGVTTPVTFRVDGLSNTVYLVDIATNGFASTTATVGSATMTDLRATTNLTVLKVASSNIVGLVTGSASIAAGSNATVTVVSGTNVISAEVGAADIAVKLDKAGGSASNITVRGQSFWYGTNSWGDTHIYADQDSGDLSFYDSRGDRPVRIHEGFIYGMGFISDNPEVINLWQVQDPETFAVMAGVDTNGVLHANLAGGTNLPMTGVTGLTELSNRVAGVESGVTGLLTLSNRVAAAEEDIATLQAGGGGGGTVTNVWDLDFYASATNEAFNVWTNTASSNSSLTLTIQWAAKSTNDSGGGRLEWTIVRSNGVDVVTSTNDLALLSDLQVTAAAYTDTAINAAIAPGIDTRGVFVDSVNGSDSNPGTYYLPWQTIAKAVSEADTNSAVINLRRGCVWREQLTLSKTNQTVQAYGFGERPILDGTDLIAVSAWAKTTGQTNVYQADVVINANESTTWVSLWEGVTRLLRATNVNDCDVRAGTYYPSADVGTNGMPITLYVHATGSGNPTNFVYEHSKRQFGLDSYSAEAPIISGVHTKRQLNNDGSFRLGANGFATDCTFTDGHKHNAYFRRNATVTRCIARDAYYTLTGTSLFIFHDTFSGGTNDWGLFEDCQTIMPTRVSGGQYGGFGSHGDGYPGTVYYRNCVSTNCNTGFSGPAAKQVVLDNCTVVNADYRGIVSYATNLLVIGGSYDTTLLNTGRPLSTETYAQNVVLSNVVLRSSIASGGNAAWLMIAGTTLDMRGCNVTGGDAAIYAPNAVTVYSRNNTITGAKYYYLTSGSSVLDSDYNTLSGTTTGNKFYLGGSNYTLDSYRIVFGQDSHSAPTTLVMRAATITVTNGYYFPSNAISAWPSAPRTPGEAFVGSSNGVIFILTSGLGSTWTATNKIAP